MVDVNGDNLDDVLVGAPTHKIRTFNEGIVYTFNNLNMVSNVIWTKINIISIYLRSS